MVYNWAKKKPAFVNHGDDVDTSNVDKVVGENTTLRKKVPEKVIYKYPCEV